MAASRAGMELGIAAGKEDGIGVGSGGSFARGEKKLRLAPRPMPLVQKMRVGKGEGRVAGNGDPLAQRAAALARITDSPTSWPAMLENPVKNCFTCNG